MSIFCDSNSISQWWFFFQKESSSYTIVKLKITQAFFLLSKKINVPVMFSTYGLVNMSIDDMKTQPYLK